MNKLNWIEFQGVVLECGIAYQMNFVECQKRNLNATFTIYSFWNSRKQMNTLIYLISICLENRTYYICIVLPASHVISLILQWIFFLFLFFSQMLYRSIFNYCYLFIFPFFAFLYSLPYCYFMFNSGSYFYVL